MVAPMKTTLNLDESVMHALEREAHRQDRTLSELVETALRLFLRRSKPAKELPPLPSFSGGRLLVDAEDREALYRAMEER